MASNSSWTFQQNKLFENALATYREDPLELFFQNVAKAVGGKTVEEVKKHYEILVEYIQKIESDKISLPNYSDDVDIKEERQVKEEEEEEQSYFLVRKASNSTWTYQQNKLFENALATYSEDPPEQFFQNVAKAVGDKSAEEVKRHYEILVEDIHRIESGQIPLPTYSDDVDIKEEKQVVDEEQRMKNLKLKAGEENGSKAA